MAGVVTGAAHARGAETRFAEVDFYQSSREEMLIRDELGDLSTISWDAGRRGLPELRQQESRGP
jgi:hypothetical protein